MSDIECPFCNLRGRVLMDNTNALVLLSDPHRAHGHFLVIPKRHIEKPWDLSKAEIQDIFELIFIIEQKIIGKLGDGCDIRQHYKPFLKQDRYKIDHIHFHVIPRSFKDRIYQITEQHDTELFEDLTEEEHDEVAKLLQ